MRSRRGSRSCRWAGPASPEWKWIPEAGQAFTFHGKRFIVMKRDKNRITKLRIRPVEPEPAKP